MIVRVDELDLQAQPINGAERQAIGSVRLEWRNALGEQGSATTSSPRSPTRKVELASFCDAIISV